MRYVIVFVYTDLVWSNSDWYVYDYLRTYDKECTSQTWW